MDAREQERFDQWFMSVVGTCWNRAKSTVADGEEVVPTVLVFGSEPGQIDVFGVDLDGNEDEAFAAMKRLASRVDEVTGVVFMSTAWVADHNSAADESLAAAVARIAATPFDKDSREAVEMVAWTGWRGSYQTFALARLSRGGGVSTLDPPALLKSSAVIVGMMQDQKER